MKKIKRIFKANPENRSLVTKEINEGMEWIFDGNSYPRWKRDGLPCAIIQGVFYKRLQVDSESGLIPDDAIPVDVDHLTNKIIYWVPILNTPENIYFLEALEQFKKDHKNWLDGFGRFEKIMQPKIGSRYFDVYCPADGTYELCGPKVQGNRENLSKHVLLPHKSVPLQLGFELNYQNLKQYFIDCDNLEGIVFYHKIYPDVMGKIRRKDFGLKWG